MRDGICRKLEYCLVKQERSDRGRMEFYRQRVLAQNHDLKMWLGKMDGSDAVGCGVESVLPSDAGQNFEGLLGFFLIASVVGVSKQS